MPAAFTSDPATTKKRVARLRAYMDANVLSPERRFCCDARDECRDSIRDGHRFHEAQLSHVGRHYDLAADGRPMRVMVVGQECGVAAPPKVTLDRRRQILLDSGLRHGYYTDRGAGLKGRNPHMRGTTSALRVAFGLGLGHEHREEWLDLAGERCHIFDAFALVNVLLCAAGPRGSSRGASTPTMRRNCLRHFVASLAILEPTLVILHGHGVAAWTAEAFGERTHVGEHVDEANIAGRRVLICRFSHPAAHAPRGWGAALDAPYLRRVVQPTMRRAVALASRAAGAPR